MEKYGKACKRTDEVDDGSFTVPVGAPGVFHVSFKDFYKLVECVFEGKAYTISPEEFAVEYVRRSCSEHKWKAMSFLGLKREDYARLMGAYAKKTRSFKSDAGALYEKCLEDVRTFKAGVQDNPQKEKLCGLLPDDVRARRENYLKMVYEETKMQAVWEFTDKTRALFMVKTGVPIAEPGDAIAEFIIDRLRDDSPCGNVSSLLFSEGEIATVLGIKNEDFGSVMADAKRDFAEHRKRIALEMVASVKKIDELSAEDSMKVDAIMERVPKSDPEELNLLSKAVSQAMDEEEARARIEKAEETRYIR